MKKYLAVRARNLFAAKGALECQSIEVVKANVERGEPALRNLVEGLHQRGLVYDIDGLGVFWLLVDSPHEPDYFAGFSAVECVFSEQWLLQAAQKVRYLKGIAYCDATSAWADEFTLKDQCRPIEVSFERQAVVAADVVVNTVVENTVENTVVENTVESTVVENAAVETTVTETAEVETAAVKSAMVDVTAVKPNEIVTARKGIRRTAVSPPPDVAPGAIVDLFGSQPPVCDARKKSRATKKLRPAVEEEQLDMFFR